MYREIKQFYNSIGSKPHLLLALVLASLTLGYAYSSILLALFLAYVFVVNGILKRIKFSLNFSLLLPIVLYLWLVITVLWTVDIHLTYKGIFRLLPLILVPLSFGFLPKIKPSELNKILKIYTLLNFISALVFLYNASLRFMESGLFCEYTYHDLVYEFDLNAIYISAFFAVSFLYLLSKKQKSKFEFFLLFFFFTIIILLSSKLIFIITTVCATVYLFLAFKNKKLLILLTIFSIVLVFSSNRISIRFQEELNTNVSEVLNNERFNQVYPWTGTSIRILQLRILKEQLSQDNIILTGYGLFASRENLEQRHKNFNTYFGYHNYNYHNQYAQTISESGIIGLILLILLLGTNIYKAIRSHYFLFISFSILIILWFATESVLWVQRGVVFFSVFYCLFAHLDYKKKLNSPFDLEFFKFNL
jgi:O-antigen ligase